MGTPHHPSNTRWYRCSHPSLRNTSYVPSNSIRSCLCRPVPSTRAPVKGLTAPGRFTFEQQHTQVLTNSSFLDDTQKIIAEFWAPGALAFGNPPNMFNLFAMNALIHTNANLQDSIKLQFALANAVFDAGIAAWDAKRFFDSSRPISAIRCLFAGQNVQAWAGPYQGVKTIDGGSWKPYQEANFVTPPFSE